MTTRLILPHRRAVLGGLAAGLAAPALVRAQASLEGPQITVIVPFPAGGGTDVAARQLMERLGQMTKARFVIENQPGGGGSIGYRAATRAPNDGSTIMLTSSAIATMPFLYPSRNFEPLRETVPVSLIGQGPSLVVVGPHLTQVNTLRDLIELARARPDELTYASAGPGSGLHLAAETLVRMAGVKVKHVPYRGAALAMGDILGGRIDMMVDILTSVRPQVGEGKLKALAITSKAHSPLAPDYAPAGETVPGYDFTAWFGVYLPAGAPPAFADQLAEAIRSALATPELRERYATLGMEAVSLGPTEFRAFMAAELDRWGRVVRDLGITAEGG